MTYLPLKISDYENKSVDFLFRKVAQDKQNEIALKGYLLCDDDQQTYTYQQCQAIIDNLCKEFMMMGLSKGDVLALQLPNSIEANLISLACFQSGITIALIPDIWRKSEVEQALIRISPQAILCPKIHDGFDFSEHMYEIAFNISSIRHLLTLGGNAADGCLALDHCFDQKNISSMQIMRPEDYQEIRAEDICLISFQKSKSGMSVPIQHNHINLVTSAFKFYSQVEDPKSQCLTTPFGSYSQTLVSANLVAFAIFDFALECLPDLNATELQSLDVSNKILFLPKSLDNDALNDALFEQECSHIVFLSKFGNEIELESPSDHIIDLITLNELGFIAQKRVGGLDLSENAEFKYQFDGEDIQHDQLLIEDNLWSLNSTNLPIGRQNEVQIASLNLSANHQLSNYQLHFNVGNVRLNFDDIEDALKQYHGVDDAAIMLFKDDILTYKPVIAIVPKMGAVILEHEIHAFLKNKQTAAHKIAEHVYEIPEIKRDYDGNVMRLTSKEALLGAKGPVKQNDGLVQIQQELAALIAANS